jgi:hypothetical protein
VQRIEGRPSERIAAGLQWSQSSGDPSDPENQMGEGCLADQLFGQTMAHLAGLGPLLDREQMGSALDSIVRYNFKRTLEDHVGLLRVYALNDEAGVVICDYGKKPAPASPFFYDTEVWPGIEYQLAALLCHEGRSQAGLEIVRAVRSRFDGVRRNPWNEAECGHHYVRSLASWTVVWLLLGFRYHASERRVTLAPRIDRDSIRGLWMAPTGWGSYHGSRAARRAEIIVIKGRLDCAELELPAAAAREARATLDGRALTSRVLRRGEVAAVALTEPISIREGVSLAVEMR